MSHAAAKRCTPHSIQFPEVNDLRDALAVFKDLPKSEQQKEQSPKITSLKATNLLLLKN